ncbi:alpha/beta hydrolase, partial [Mycobacterium tuberculosis]|uniref:alpha/beta hydrolase n=1 Tax=Mycobacterium tuberculosis TaxID=1773 RepID=UPI001BE05F7F
ARDQPPAEVSDQRVSGLTGAVQKPVTRERCWRLWELATSTTPDGLKDVMHDWSARDAAGPLNRFDKGLAATTNVSDQHITAFGHSYGSLVTSLALQQGAPVSDVVLYGSPGTELTHASQLGVEPGHAFYMIGVNDHVANTIPEFGAFGSAPQDVPGMTQLSVNTGLAPGPLLGDGQLHERA